MGCRRSVVEPNWQGQVPDIVVVGKGAITDIFELKYVPHYYPDFKQDIQKLASYVEDGQKFPVSIDPETGQWRDPLPVSPDCRLHFVAVGKPDAEALDTNAVRQHIKQLEGHALYHWQGQSGEKRVWEVDKAA